MVQCASTVVVAAFDCPFVYLSVRTFLLIATFSLRFPLRAFCSFLRTREEGTGGFRRGIPALCATETLRGSTSKPGFRNKPQGRLPYQANRFCATNREVAIETREVMDLGNSRTAGSFPPSALCGGAIEKPDFGFPGRVYATSSLACREVHAPARFLVWVFFCHARNRRVG